MDECLEISQTGYMDVSQTGHRDVSQTGHMDVSQTDQLDLNKLFEGYCVLCFLYEDGSRIECLSTLNPGILTMHGLCGDAIYDIESRKKIPDILFDKLDEIRSGKAKNLSALDKFFECGIKAGWEEEF